MYVLKAKKILTQQNQYSKLKKREKYASLTDEKGKKRAKARENYQAKGKEINLDGKRLFWTVFTVMFWKGLTFISHYISWFGYLIQLSGIDGSLVSTPFNGSQKSSKQVHYRETKWTRGCTRRCLFLFIMMQERGDLA